MIAIRSASEVPWADLERVFETPGDPRTCWCQYFKVTPAEWDATDAQTFATRLHEQTRRGDPTPGLIAYVDDEAAGWVAVEPRDNYPRLRRSRVVQSGSAETWGDASVWSVVCFVVRREFRRQGTSGALIAAAVDRARAGGARVVEGYPVEPALISGSDADALYHGTVSMFEAAGFSEIAVPTPSRRVMARDLSAVA
ncbi:N-acetyltransferase family protein [Conyzicola sp.]|uniref:GNAT family N-acetyltransferase n=1 Tax=Conyzicola sp. TaxID=1969404 RepID=UPI003989B584